jgi:hypothetical protein
MMTAAEFCEALAQLGLSKGDAGELFGTDPRTPYRWARGDRPIPPTVAMLLRLMLRGKVTAHEITAAQS